MTTNWFEYFVQEARNRKLEPEITPRAEGPLEERLLIDFDGEFEEWHHPETTGDEALLECCPKGREISVMFKRHYHNPIPRMSLTPVSYFLGVGVSTLATADRNFAGFVIIGQNSYILVGGDVRAVLEDDVIEELLANNPLRGKIHEPEQVILYALDFYQKLSGQGITPL